MIDYTSYKKAYTDGSLFTLTGADFTGYAQLKDGVVTEVSTGKTLSPKSTYATDLFYTNYFQDRVIADEELTLPNTENDCLFNLNDNFNYDLFKFKLDTLRENNTYVYSRLFISSNKLPAADAITYASAPNNYSTGFEINVSDADNPQFKSNVRFSDNNFLSAFGYIVDATAQVDYDDSIGIDELTYDMPILIKMIDVLGREQQEHKKASLLFYIYDNGKIEKKVIH